VCFYLGFYVIIALEMNLRKVTRLEEVFFIKDKKDNNEKNCVIGI